MAFTMTLLNQINQLSQNEQSEKATLTDQCLEHYRLIIRRHENPEPGDAETLRGLMDVLALNTSDVAADIADVVRDLALAAKTQAPADAQAELDALDQRESEAKSARIQRSRDVVNAKAAWEEADRVCEEIRSEADIRRAEIRVAPANLAKHRRKNPRMFPPATMKETITEAVIERADTASQDKPFASAIASDVPAEEAVAV
jgi:hypothetical protein